MFWTIVFAASVTLFLAVYSYFRRRADYFKRIGLPGPEPSSIFTGSIYEMQADGAPVLKLRDWARQYGETFGILDGGNKTIVTSDLDLLQDVFVRRFENFHGRRPNLLRPFNPDRERE